MLPLCIISNEINRCCLEPPKRANLCWKAKNALRKHITVNECTCVVRMQHTLSTNVDVNASDHSFKRCILLCPVFSKFNVTFWNGFVELTWVTTLCYFWYIYTSVLCDAAVFPGAFFLSCRTQYQEGPYLF